MFKSGRGNGGRDVRVRDLPPLIGLLRMLVERRRRHRIAKPPRGNGYSSRRSGLNATKVP